MQQRCFRVFFFCSLLLSQAATTKEEESPTAQHEEGPKLAELDRMKAARAGLAGSEALLRGEAAKNKPALSVGASFVAAVFLFVLGTGQKIFPLLIHD